MPCPVASAMVAMRVLLVEEESFQEIPADLIHRRVDRIHPHPVPREALLRDHVLLDFHRELPLLVLLAHAAKKRDGPDARAVPAVQRADAELRGQRPSGGCLDENELRHRSPGIRGHAAKNGTRIVRAQALAENRPVIEHFRVEAAPADDLGRGEAGQLLRRPVPEHDPPARIDDIEAVLHLVEKLGEGNLRKYGIGLHCTRASVHSIRCFGVFANGR